MAIIITPVPWAVLRSRMLDLYRGPHRSVRTLKKLEYVLRLAEGLGAESTSDLTTEFAAKFCRERSEKVCLNTVRGEMMYLKAIANYAVEEDWLERGPKWRRVWPRRVGRSRNVLYQVEEVWEVMRHLRGDSYGWEGHRLYALFATVAYTGLRRDEALFLKVEDVRLDDRLIDVVSRPERRLKTVESEAPVPVPEELAPILARWLPRCGTEWLFPAKRGGGPWSGGSYGCRPTESIRLAAERVGVRGLTLAALRHTFATWSRRRWGLDAPQLQNILRHTTERTQVIYIQPDRSDLVASVSRVSYRAS